MRLLAVSSLGVLGVTALYILVTCLIEGKNPVTFVTRPLRRHIYRKHVLEHTNRMLAELALSGNLVMCKIRRFSVSRSQMMGVSTGGATFELECGERLQLGTHPSRLSALLVVQYDKGAPVVCASCTWHRMRERTKEDLAGLLQASLETE